MARAVFSLLFLAALGGCVSEAQVRAADERQCASYGFQSGTVAFAECLQRESLARRYGWEPVAPAPPFRW